MSTANLTVPSHFVTIFDKSWKHLAQQKISRLKDFVMVKMGCTGEAETHNQIGAVEGEETTGQRFKKVTLSDLPTALRWIFPKEFQLPTGESYWDENRLLPTISPKGEHTVAHAGYFGRQCDREILTGLLGTAYAGPSKTSTSFDTANMAVAKDLSGSDADLTVLKLIRAKRILQEQERWNDDMREMGMKLCIATNARMEETLLNDANSTTGSRLFSKDYMPPTLDEEGRIQSFLGISFRRTELVNINNVTDGDADTICYAPLWVNTAVQLDVWGSWGVSVDRRPDLSNATQFLSQFSVGSARLDELGVVRIACEQN